MPPAFGSPADYAAAHGYSAGETPVIDLVPLAPTRPRACLGTHRAPLFSLPTSTACMNVTCAE
ncbi:MAG: hypothetical protein AVDCRST_MAG93-9608 [uncultured Chloroflexia bacterium]|uniref:Uncharacterized protein n=1 Tax=uncultured Chloroflexia bacterium TaxID=1672391 RepID=A0A6J4NLP7_9CHLR|nr:MAG: hypothetical protein AVDCRST_MAG93-9608 [uncultured Chloroflexia bacterium]